MHLKANWGKSNFNPTPQHPIRPHRWLTGDGQTATSYHRNTEPLVFRVIDSWRGRDAAKLQLMLREIEFSEAAVSYSIDLLSKKISSTAELTSVLSEPTDLMLQALYRASVISYGKIFSKQGSGRAKLERRDLFCGVDSRFLPFHTWIMEEHRHKHIAHSSNPDLDDAITIFAFPFPSQLRAEATDIFPHATYAAQLSLGDCQEFLKLIRFVKQHLNKRIQKIRLEISSKEIAMIPQGELYKNIQFCRFRISLRSPGPIPDA